MEPNFVLQGELEEVACFFYMTKGSMSSYDMRGVHTTTQHNSILKNCGRYIQEFKAFEGDQECEAIAVFLYPDLLKEIFQDEIPSYLTNVNMVAPKRYISNRLIEQYMHNLSIYFNEPDAFDEELGVLKLKEMIHILLKSENSAGVR